MMTSVDHNATALPDAQAFGHELEVFGALSKAKIWLGQYLKACNGELVESVFEWVAENSFKLLLTLTGFISEATNWF